MNLSEYQQRARATAEYPGQADLVGVMYAALGLNGEAGECAEQVKKAWRNDGAMTEERRVKLAGEVGDVLWYAAQLATELDLDLQQLAEANLAKLGARQAKGLIAREAANR